MDSFKIYIRPYWDLAAVYWQQLDYSTRWNIWLGFGILGLIVLLATWHRIFRQLLGHTKFRGTWYSADQFQQLVNILKEDQDSGRRVMRHDEIALLRTWIHGRDGIGIDKAKHGFW